MANSKWQWRYKNIDGDTYEWLTSVYKLCRNKKVNEDLINVDNICTQGFKFTSLDNSIKFSFENNNIL